MNIYIGGPVEVSDMQGPAPDGFHVPLSTEWKAIYNAYKGLGFSGFNYFSSYLKLPKAGYREYNKSVYDVGSSGNYWSSTAPDGTSAFHLRFTTSSINPEISDYRSRGCTVRCIKNSPTIPTASWTTLYQGSGSAGIFRNQTDGLISISSDGTTWYTLMDKNLGATTVYNYGDTLTEDNCGNVFQRGNNYAFPGTKSSSSITSSSTKVDVTGYGPGNYYSSSTFITANPRQSSASDGNNLRGGVTQGSGTKSVEVQNIYMGEYVKPDYLCFTANTAGSTVKLNKTGSPTAVTLETSTDGSTWSTYTFGSTITLSNIGDKVYWRNTSETDTRFSVYNGSLYQFVMTGSISGSGDVNFLLNKNSTTTLSNYCFIKLFYQCLSLTTAPKLPATTLADNCYHHMFDGCDNLTTLPKIYVTSTASDCCSYMFDSCSKIKLSTTQTGDYQTPYRIPPTGTGTGSSSDLYYMFYQTGGTFTGTPSLNTTYYTSNTVV